jgi:hypothetical protein
MRVTNRILVLCALMQLPAAAGAQFMFVLDGGQRAEKYGTGFTRTIPYGGIGLGAALAGDAGENAGFVLSANGEFKFGGSGAMDGRVYGDAMMRLGPLAFGPGLDLTAPMVGDIPDKSQADGKLGIIDEQIFGYSGSAKLSFGPLGKAFIQTRITTYPAGSGLRLINGCNSEYLTSDQSAQCSDVSAQHDPEFRSGDEARISLGYVFSGGGGARILRAQWVQQRLNYMHEKDNLSGAYDRRNQALMLGLVLVM